MLGVAIPSTLLYELRIVLLGQRRAVHFLCYSMDAWKDHGINSMIIG